MIFPKQPITNTNFNNKIIYNLHNIIVTLRGVEE